MAERLRECSADVVTLSGSGEPTLHSGIQRVIEAVREVMDMQVAVLTNGSLLWRPEVRERLLAAHKVLPTLTSGYEETFQRIHRPHPQITLARLLSVPPPVRRTSKTGWIMSSAWCGTARLPC